MEAVCAWLDRPGQGDPMADPASAQLRRGKNPMADL